MRTPEEIERAIELLAPYVDQTAALREAICVLRWMLGDEYDTFGFGTLLNKLVVFEAMRKARQN